MHGKLNPVENEELRKIFQANDLEEVYLQDLSGPRYIFQHIPEEYLAFLNTDVINHTLLIHEGFHFSDFTQKTLTKSWSQNIFIDRDDTERCYSDERGKSFFAEEVRSLSKLFEASLSKDLESARGHLAEYYDTRAKRYEALKGFTPTGYKTSPNTSCREAERNWEFKEGVAEFVANAFLFDRNFMTKEEFLSGLSLDKGFYLTGLIKLYALKTFLGPEFINELRGMLKSDDDDYAMEEILNKALGMSP